MERPLNPLRELGARVAAEQDALPVDREALAAVRDRLLAPRPRRSAARARTWVTLAAAACLAAVTILWLRAPRALRFNYPQGAAMATGLPGAWLAADATEPMSVNFSDGSRVTLTPTTRARVLEVEPAGATMLLESGRASVAVVHRPGGQWRMNAGPFSVRVTGTKFDLEWDAAREELLLALHEGHVVVSGCNLGEGRDVFEGELLRASCARQSIEITNEAAAAAPAAPGSQQASAPAVPSGVPLASVDGGGAGTPGAASVPRPGDAAPSGDELMAAADAARLSGQYDKATASYLALRRRYPGTPQAGVAAFALGRIAFDRRGAFPEAAEWFRTSVRESPDGPLSMEARGRLMEALSRAGDRAAAAALAADYLRRYPSGPHADLARRVARE
jgi:TolA-binding protein